MQAIDYEMKVGELNARIEMFTEQVQRALNETGAPTLDELVLRFKRFAENNKTLSHANKEQAAQVMMLKQNLDAADAEIDRSSNSIKEARVKASELEAQVAALLQKMQAKDAALKETNNLLDQPMFAAFNKDTRPVQKAINAALRGSEG